ncbi:MAG: NAD(P)H-hydrate dehydratase [Bacteroidetes bacterium HGW-Bacteroidetes-5]|jgi:NAD(P)H-hydrate epimerase|nr:MAG: NAD(P)H-hydrate dehydratase [Bacteroidetes bacterium HGW-Bacteroidetes-5]
MKIFTSGQIAQIDQITLKSQSISEYELIQRVADVLSRWLTLNIPLQNRRVLIFAGPGNNGKDAVALSSLLAEQKISCELFRVNQMESISDIPQIDQNCLVIDGIFGTGLNRSPEGIYARVIRAINNSNAKVVSIDIPGGLFSDTITLDCNGAVIKADITLTLEFPKLAIFFKENSKFIGDWKVLDIGLDNYAKQNIETPYYVIDKEFVSSVIKRRVKNSHKGDYGHTLLVAGSYGMAGAAILCSKGALRSGAGLVTLNVPEELYEIVQGSVPEAMCLTSIVADYDKFTTIAFGPGIGTSPETVKRVSALLKSCTKPMVIDADGLNIISANREMLDLIPLNSVLTPHPKEFSRLAGDLGDSAQALQMQLAFSLKYRVYVLLKGSNTSLSTPDGEIWFNVCGNPGMATGGSGDVLTGVIAALMAQGYSPKESAISALFIHSTAGDFAAKQFGEISMIAGDIVNNLGEAFKYVTDREEDKITVNNK